MSRSARQWATTPSLPPDHYVSSSIFRDNGVFKEETEKILKRTWKLACHVSEIAEPGDFRAYEYCGMPLVTIRGMDGVVRSFLNICSHRSALLVREPSGNARTLRCFFHLWAYDTAGACISMTRDVGYEGAGPKKEDVGLRAVKTEVRLGMAFINLDDESEDLESYLGDALAQIEECMGTKELEVFHYHRTILQANWKQWQETNMDGYHHWGHAVNRMTNLKADGAFERRWLTGRNGHGTIDPVRIDYSNVRGWSDRTNSLPGLGPGELRAVDLFPNTAIIVRGTCVRIDTTSPLSPTETLLECRGLGIKGEPPEDRALRVHDHNQFWGPLGRNIPEDVAFVEAIGRANRQGAQFSIMSRREAMKSMDEGLMRHFYREWSRRMGRDAADPFHAADVIRNREATPGLEESADRLCVHDARRSRT